MHTTAQGRRPGAAAGGRVSAPIGRLQVCPCQPLPETTPDTPEILTNQRELSILQLMRYFLLTLLVLTTASAGAQFRVSPQGEPAVVDELIQSSASPMLFGWFNPDRFHMRHTFSLSYMTMAGNGLSLGTYTNSMMYQIADNLNARADVSFTYSPYNSFSQYGTQDLSGVYLSRAQVDYRPWKDVSCSSSTARTHRTLSPWDMPWSPPWYREDGF